MRAATKQSAQKTSEKSGDNSGEVTPVPISNTVVKLLSADDTWWEAAWESRTLPVFYLVKTSSGMFFSCPERGSVSTFRKEGFLRLCMQRCCKEGNLETRRTQPARYMDVAGFFSALI